MKNFWITAAFIGMTALAAQPAASQVATPSIEELADRDLDWVEDADDFEEIVLLATVGQPDVRRNSYRCNNMGYFSDYVGEDTNGQYLCLKQMNLTSNVFDELAINHEYRFFNESDYDRRITKVYAFRHNGSLNQFLDNEELSALFIAMKAPVQNNYSVATGTYGDLHDNLTYSLYIGDDYHGDTLASQYILNTIGEDTSAKLIRVRKEVGLYPGGGFQVDYNLIVTEDMLIYVKIEGWDA